LLAEQLIDVAAAAAIVGTHPTTVTRWLRVGIKRGDGTVRRLEGARAGGQWRTSRQALGRFLSPAG
jgi:hypothetical protein